MYSINSLLTLGELTDRKCDVGQSINNDVIDCSMDHLRATKINELIFHPWLIRFCCLPSSLAPPNQRGFSFLRGGDSVD